MVPGWITGMPGKCCVSGDFEARPEAIQALFAPAISGFVSFDTRDHPVGSIDMVRDSGPLD